MTREETMTRENEKITANTVYTCNTCNTDFTNKSAAVACADAHQSCVKISDWRYCANEAYPFTIEVTFSDGKKRWYRVE